MGSELEKNYHLGARIGVVIPEIARQIKNTLEVDNWNTASEKKLKLRDEIHKKIIFGSKMQANLKNVVDLALTDALINDVMD